MKRRSPAIGADGLLPVMQALVALFVLAMLAAAGLAAAGAIGSHAAACHLSQPVYAGTMRVGSWHATLHPGQSVLLPDGDTASCTGPEQVTVH